MISSSSFSSTIPAVRKTWREGGREVTSLSLAPLVLPVIRAGLFLSLLDRTAENMPIKFMSSVGILIIGGGGGGGERSGLLLSLQG